MQVMQIYKKIVVLLVVALPFFAGAQRIHYSEPGRDDYRQVNFEIIGKLSNNILVYKNYRSKNDLSVFDNEMKLKNN